MWPIVYALIRRNAVYLTLPVAVVVGFIGYNVESIFSIFGVLNQYSIKILIFRYYIH